MNALCTMFRRAAICLPALVFLVSSASVWAGSPPGRLLWEDRLDAGPFDFSGRDVIATGAGHLFVGGGVTGSGGSIDFLVRAYDGKNGSLLWEDRFDLGGGDGNVLGLTANEGRVFAAGDATTAAGVLVPIIRAYDGRTGALLWQDVAATQGVMDSSAVHGGRVFAIGAVGEDAIPVPGSSFFFRSDWFVRAYEAKTGQLLWQDRFGAPDPAGAVQRDRPVTVAAGGGKVVVGGRGRTTQLGASRWLVRAHDALTGSLLWQDLGIFGQANTIAIVGDRVVVAGTVVSQVSPLNRDWLIRVYDANSGAVLWQDIVDRGISLLEAAQDLVVSDGRVFVAGIAGVTCRVGVVFPTNCDGLIRGYDLASGQLLWEDRFDEAPLDEFVSVAARGGRVFAVGQGSNDCDASGLPTNCDMIVRAYDAATGHLLWDDRVNKDGTDDSGSAVAIHGGRVFASGVVFDSSSFADLLVRAYASGGDDEPENE